MHIRPGFAGEPNSGPKYMKRGTASKYLEGPGRKEGETYEEYRARRRDEQDLLSFYMRGTPVDTGGGSS